MQKEKKNLNIKFDWALKDQLSFLLKFEPNKYKKNKTKTFNIFNVIFIVDVLHFIDKNVFC